MNATAWLHSAAPTETVECEGDLHEAVLRLEEPQRWHPITNMDGVIVMDSLTADPAEEE